MKKMLSIFLFLLFLVPMKAIAEPTMKLLKKGEPAPYQGILLNDEAQATILQKIERQKHQCDLDRIATLSEKQIECNHSLALKENECSGKLERSKIEFESCKSTKQDLLERLAKYEAQDERKVWLVGIGIATGAAITIFAIIAAGQLQQ